MHLPGQRLRFLTFWTVLALLAASAVASDQAQPAQSWPHPIPCRVRDGNNNDVFVMTLGDVQTPLAQGVFDPEKDSVTLSDGAVSNHYFRDSLGIKFYQPLDKSRFQLPPSGWCTWYYYYSHINATEVRRNAEWIAANLKDFGARYVQIDDGWQGGGARDGVRDWTRINSQRFPEGMAKLAADIKSLGLTPGLWLAPHGQSYLNVVTNHPGVFLLKPDGSTASDTWEGRYLVDGSSPESMAYLKDLFTRLSSWGYEYFKIDGQPIVVDEYRTKKEFMKNPSDDAEGLYRNTIQSIREAIGPDRYLLGCWGIPIEGAGIMNGSRTGGDVVLGWGGFQVALHATLEHYYLHNIVWYSDPDTMLVRSPLTLDQARVWAALQGLTGQALMSSDRLPDLSEERVELLRRVYPATDVRPLDLFPAARDKRIWDLKINHLGRSHDVVGVFNFNEGKPEHTFLRWADLGLPSGLVHVFDFWNKEYLGAWDQGMLVEAAPTSCRLLTLVPADSGVQLVSTSRHVTQGWVDLLALKRNDSGNAFSGVSKLIKEDPYELRFAFPRGTNYSIKNASAESSDGALPVKCVNHQGWAVVQITSPHTSQVQWQVEFAPADSYDYPVAEPTRPWLQRVGLDGVSLHWQEQYYLNAGYQVSLNGDPVGFTSEPMFVLRGLNPFSNYVAQIRTVWENGAQSPRHAELKFTIASLLPEELSLSQLEPVRSNARWRGIEADEELNEAPFLLAGSRYEKGLGASPNSEIEYDLKGLYGEFSVLVGVDFSTRSTNGLEFVILGDDKELWRSGMLRSSDEPKAATVAIPGVQKLVLRANGQGGRGNRSQGDWVNPRLTRRVSAQNEAL